MRERFSGGNRPESMAVPAGAYPASPMPMAERAISNWGKLLVKAQATVASRPDKGHDADGLFPAPAVNEDRDGKDEDNDGPVNHRHEQAGLGVRKSIFLFNEREKGCHDHPIDIIEEIQQKQEGEDIIGTKFGQLVFLGCSYVIHGTLLINYLKGYTSTALISAKIGQRHAARADHRGIDLDIDAGRLSGSKSRLQRRPNILRLFHTDSETAQGLDHLMVIHPAQFRSVRNIVPQAQLLAVHDHAPGLIVADDHNDREVSCGWRYGIP